MTAIDDGARWMSKEFQFTFPGGEGRWITSNISGHFYFFWELSIWLINTRTDPTGVWSLILEFLLCSSYQSPVRCAAGKAVLHPAVCRFSLWCFPCYWDAFLISCNPSGNLWDCFLVLLGFIQLKTLHFYTPKGLNQHSTEILGHPRLLPHCSHS